MIAKFEKRKRGTLSASDFLGIIALILILVIAGFLVFSNIRIKQQKDKIEAQLAAIEKEIGDFQSKNKDLEEKISNIKDQDYIERVLREELYQKEGERVIGFILPSEDEQANKGRGFWQPSSWWRWLVGTLKSWF